MARFPIDPPTMYQHLRAPNDRNGNPRRLWAFYTGAGMVDHVIDEGYGGRPQEAQGLAELPAINIAPSEYRAWIHGEQSRKERRP